MGRFKCPPLPGCGTQHPHRALGGTCVLLAAVPTTPPCFRHWRRSSSLRFGHIQRNNYFNFTFGATAFAERSVAMEAPVGLLSGRAVCVSRWRGFAPTSSAERSKRIFTSGVVKLNCICHTAFSLVNLFYQYFRFYNSSVLYYNEVATLFLKSTGGCFLDS